MGAPRRYTEKRRYERSLSRPEKVHVIENPRDHSQPCIPVRLNEKTVVLVRERNIERYRVYFSSGQAFEKHIARWKEDPDNFFV